jgi:GWxTD domain-containing protein
MKKTAYFIGLLLLITACFNLNNISLYNLSNQYSTTNFTQLDAAAFNNNLSGEATIFLPVTVSDMATAYDETSKRSFTHVMINYELFSNYESKTILDSASFHIIDSSMRIADTVFSFDVVYPGQEKYILKVVLTDMNRVDDIDTYLVLDNTSDQSPNNYLLRDEESEILFWNVIGRDEIISLELADGSPDQVYVRYYQRDFPLALPPFLEDTETSFNYQADSIFEMSVVNSTTIPREFYEEGFYHFQTDTTQKAGYTIFRFYKDFPSISSTEQMIKSLRYITTKTEFNELNLAEDKKLALDNFWLGNAGNPSRARAMIQKYYGRVEDANRFFSSYLEGWKTDRGLIYIVYGPPRVVYRGKNMEEWLYGEKGNKNAIRFQFVKVDNPFTENDYSMIKSPSYKEKWYNIVNNWRR